MPVHLADFASRVEETLQDVRKDDSWTESDSHSLDGVENGTDDMWRSCREDEVSNFGSRQQ